MATEQYHTRLHSTHLCGIGDGGGGLAVLACACWSLVVLSLFLGCSLVCSSWFYIWLPVFLVLWFRVDWLCLYFCCWSIHFQVSLFDILVS